MIIYRIEHRETGFGPWQGNSEHRPQNSWCVDYYSSPHFDHFQTLPSHIEEGIGSQEHQCGCKSISQLKHWFGDYLQALHQTGFVLRLFEADAQIGKWQVAFKRTQATWLSEISLLEC